MKQRGQRQMRRWRGRMLIGWRGRIVSLWRYCSRIRFQDTIVKERDISDIIASSLQRAVSVQRLMSKKWLRKKISRDVSEAFSGHISWWHILSDISIEIWDTNRHGTLQFSVITAQRWLVAGVLVWDDWRGETSDLCEWYLWLCTLRYVGAESSW